MSANTTLNMNRSVIKKINFASEISGKSRSKIIIMLLMKVMANDNGWAGKPGTVQYQERDDKEMWKPFHITYQDEEYEYFQDLRRLLKMSVSFAVAYGVKKYLDEILFGKDTDNYKFTDYKLTRKVIKGEIKFIISWGIPEIMEKLIPLDTS